LMQHDPIETMLDEHEVIVSVVERVDGIEDRWEHDPNGYVSVVAKLIRFFREYADGYHHRKEEEVLFPAIRSHPDFILDELIDEFEQHHVDFRQNGVDIETAIAEGDHALSFRLLKTYCEELLDHIAAENDELFIMAETLLDENDLETIFFKFKDIDLELGEERKVELEKTVSELEWP